MSENSGEGTVTSSNAAASVSAEMKQELQKIVMGIVPDIVSRSLKKSLTETLPSMLKELAPAAAPVDEKKPDDKTGEGGRSLKALEAKVNELSQQLKQRDEAIEQKEQQRVDALMRGEVREALAGALGADNPNLPLVMDSLYDARKRFVRDESGQTLVRFKAEYGSEDDLVPLKDGLKKLVDGELKHMLPAKTSGLPGVRARAGQPAQQNANGAGSNVLDTIFSNVAAQAAAAGSNQK
jgi:hypothetical protein